MNARVSISREEIAAFCRRHHIRRLSLFGCVLREDFGPGSDVDILVEFEPGHTPGLGIVDVGKELSQLLGGRRVDLVNPKYLNPRIRDNVLATTATAYEKG